MEIYNTISDKYAALKANLETLPSLAVAFSGGVDSSLLLAVAIDVLGDRVVALTADSALHPTREIRAAVAVGGLLKAHHILIRTDEMDQALFRANTFDRCYRCKKMVFGHLLKRAAKLGIGHMAHGANRDDLKDYRPGLQAAKEMGIRAPLIAADLSKAEIRRLARDRGLPNWNRPAMACLASRIPYHTPLSRTLLARVEAAENLLEDLGFRGGRIRSHGDVARIELATEEDLAQALAPAKRNRLVAGLKAAGFTYIALDLEGYRQGSLNAPLVDRSVG
jgi:uncharacterized protein